MDEVGSAQRTGTAGAEVTSLDRAIEVFVRGFCLTRSFTHPYAGERVGPIWVIRDAPRKGGEYRNEEWIAHGVEPGVVDRVARERTRGKYAVCAICGTGEADGPLREGYKALGYRLTTTEPMFAHRLKRIPRFAPPARVERVRSEETALRLARTAGSRQMLPEHLSEDAPLRQYVAWVEGEIVGWVRSVLVGDATWCSNMYVKPEHRRRGVARGMLCRMLREDRERGANAALLLASHAGAKLYPVVGYERIATLLLFTPRKR